MLVGCHDNLSLVGPMALWRVLRSTRESVMILFIIGAAGVFSYMFQAVHYPIHRRVDWYP